MRYKYAIIYTESPSMRREWIEILQLYGILAVRKSPSMRREWIEMMLSIGDTAPVSCLPPCGGSGLKYYYAQIITVWSSLPPCGGSGLKCVSIVNSSFSTKSPSMRREWIEMRRNLGKNASWNASPSMRREWIEIFLRDISRSVVLGLPPCGGSGLK